MKITSRVASFNVDHRELKEGIYLRSEHNGTRSWDIRCIAPSHFERMSSGASHVIEHMLAHYLRETEIADEIIAFCPMGCLTGFYLITTDEVSYEAVKQTVVATMKRCFPVYDVYKVPGMNKEQCGSPFLYDMKGASETILRFLIATKNFAYDLSM